MLLACDPSTTKFGLCFGGPKDARPRTAVLLGKGADDLVFDRTLVSLFDTIDGYARLTGAKHCVIEKPLVLMDRSPHTMVALIQLTGAVRTAAARAGCVVTLVAPSKVRAYFIGAGNLKSAPAKAAVQDRCRSLGWEFADDNAADAAAVWAWGMAKFYPQWPGNALLTKVAA